MSGAHRRDRHPSGGSGKSIRWLPTVALIAALAVLVGFAIYLLVIATNLEQAIAILVIWIAMFAWAIAKRGEDWALLCAAASLVLSWTLEVVSLVAHRDRWPASDLWVIGMTSNCLRVITVIAVGLSLIAAVRSGRLSWPPWRPAPQGGADPE